MDEKKKQAIEEMASIICKETSNKGVCEKCDFKKHKQFGFVYQCSKFDNAEDIYNAGYRKESDTAREILTVLRRQFPPSKMDDRATLDDCYMIDIIEDLACKYGVDLGE